MTMVIMSTFWGCKRISRNAKMPEKTETALSVVGDKYYLNFADGNSVEVEDNADECIDATLKMESLYQLKSKIINVNFTEKEKNHIKKYFSKDENGILIYNPNNIYAPHVKDAEITQISWLGRWYSVELENNDKNYKVVAFCYDDQKVIHNQLDNHLKFYTAEGYDGRADINIISEEHDETAGRSTYHYTVLDYEWKCIRYTIEKENRKLYVEERYALFEDSFTKPSEVTPHSIEVYCEMEDYLFWIAIYPEQPLSEDVIYSIGATRVELAEPTRSPGEKAAVPTDVTEEAGK